MSTGTLLSVLVHAVKGHPNEITTLWMCKKTLLYYSFTGINWKSGGGLKRLSLHAQGVYDYYMKWA